MLPWKPHENPIIQPQHKSTQPGRQETVPGMQFASCRHDSDKKYKMHPAELETDRSAYQQRSRTYNNRIEAELLDPARKRLRVLQQQSALIETQIAKIEDFIAAERYLPTEVKVDLYRIIRTDDLEIRVPVALAQ